MPFILFAGFEYYPSGGVNDYVHMLPTLQDAVEFADRWTKNSGFWAQVIETFDAGLKVVAVFKNGKWNYSIVTPTLESQAPEHYGGGTEMGDLIWRVVHPAEAAEMDAMAEIYAQEEQKKNLVDKLFSELFKAIKADDKEAIGSLTQQLHDLGIDS